MVKESSDSGVELKQAAESVAAANGLAFGTQRYVGRREEEKVALTLMVSLLVKVLEKIGHRPPQRTLPEQDQSRQALLFNRTNPALRKRVGMSLQMRRMATLKVDVSK